MDVNAHVLVSLVALGMGAAFVSADRHSPASRALAGGFVFIGLSIYLNVVVPARHALSPAWSGWFALPEAIAIVCVLEWILRVRRTLPVAAGVDTRAGDYGLRLGQFSGLLYGLFSLLWPELRLSAFLRAADHPELFLSGGFWLFMAPIALAMLAGLAGILLLLNRRPDRAEAIRVVAMALATPLFVAGFVLPVDYAALSVVIGEIVFLMGAVHYHVLQGQRGQFLSRFLSPDVARLVSERGLDQAMRESNREITVVSCDLRGFTAYAAAHPSSEVLSVLREYYDDVGREAAAFGATIKDYAGDGVLILVGAPLPVAYHAQRGIELAQRIRAAGGALCQRWGRPGSPLGIGVGVATGTVTVGVVGSASRLEYTAVGPAVNLASRLCEQAGDGEILIDARSAGLAASTPLQARPPLELKGFAAPVPYFVAPAPA
jgi:adenylate cyclase